VLSADNPTEACTERASELECIRICKPDVSQVLSLLERVHAEKEKTKEKEEQAEIQTQTKASLRPQGNPDVKKKPNGRIIERRWPKAVGAFCIGGLVFNVYCEALPNGLLLGCLWASLIMCPGPSVNSREAFRNGHMSKNFHFESKQAQKRLELPHSVVFPYSVP
jgi:hypothetical protein